MAWVQFVAHKSSRYLSWNWCIFRQCKIDQLQLRFNSSVIIQVINKWLWCQMDFMLPLLLSVTIVDYYFESWLCIVRGWAGRHGAMQAVTVTHQTGCVFVMLSGVQKMPFSLVFSCRSSTFLSTSVCSWCGKRRSSSSASVMSYMRTSASPSSESQVVSQASLALCHAQNLTSLLPPWGFSCSSSLFTWGVREKCISHS